MQLRPVSYMPIFSTLFLDSLFEPTQVQSLQLDFSKGTVTQNNKRVSLRKKGQTEPHNIPLPLPTLTSIAVYTSMSDRSRHHVNSTLVITSQLPIPYLLLKQEDSMLDNGSTFVSARSLSTRNRLRQQESRR